MGFAKGELVLEVGYGPDCDDELRAEISNFLEKTRPIDRVKNEGLAALRRQTIKPMLEQEIAQIQQTFTNPSHDNTQLAHYLKKVIADVLANIELFESNDDDEDEDEEDDDEYQKY